MDLRLLSTGESDYVNGGNVKQSDLIDKTQIIVSQLNFKPQKEKEGGGVLEGSRQWRVADFPTKQSFIRAGLGYGYLPEQYVRKYIDNGSLAEIQCMAPVKMEIVVLRRLKDPMGPAKTLLWDNLKSED